MRANFSILGCLFLVGAVVQAINHNYLLAGASVAVALFMFVVHFIRVRRFRKFDQDKRSTDAF